MTDRKCIILYQPPTRPWGMPNMSPFCAKLETYLRIRGLNFEARPADIRKAPKGKLPYVDLGGSLVGDSQLIIERLEREYLPGLDNALSDDQRAQGHAIQRMLEEGFYFVGVYLRWWDDEGFALLRPEFERVLPGPIKLLMPMIRGRVRKMLRAQGTGRHTRDEVERLGRSDMHALSTLLGSKPFLFGEHPSSFDAVAYAFLEGFTRFPLQSSLKSEVLALTNLLAYRDRIRQRWWSDL